EAEFGNVREQVKRTFGIHAGDAWNAVQFFESERTPFREFCQPCLQVILRSVQRGDGALLRERGWIARAMALNGVDGFRDRFRRGENADAPSGHGPRLGQSMHDDGMIVMRL